MKLTILRYLCVALCAVSVTAQSDTINWYVNHAPPSSFTHGDFKGKGFIDQALALIQQELPEYGHHIVSSDIATATAKWQAGELLCFPAMVKTQAREAFVHFSQMSVVHPSNYIAMSPELAKSQGQIREADLQALLSNDDIYLGVRSGFAFGPQIDDLIKKYGINSIMIFKEEQSLEAMYQLLANNRIDYLIGYPFESYFVTSRLAMKDKVINLPIKGVTKFTMGAVGCTKNAWGKKVITRIDQALTKLKSQKAYQQALTSWLDNYIDQEEFDRFYQTEFLSH